MRTRHPRRGVVTAGVPIDDGPTIQHLRAMPSAPDFQPRKLTPAEAQELRWHELLQRLQTLNAQLEYLKLMMKLGVR